MISVRREDGHVKRRMDGHVLRRVDGHVLRMVDGDVLRRALLFEVEGQTRKDKPGTLKQAEGKRIGVEQGGRVQFGQ